MRPTLRSARQFADVYARGRKRVSPAFVLFHLDAPDARAAYVASRKVGGAVQRNRAKRVLRAALAAVDARGAAPGWVVLVARREILAQSSLEVAERLRALLAATAQDAAAERSERRVVPPREEP